jgi:hypothetical protein
VAYYLINQNSYSGKGMFQLKTSKKQFNHLVLLTILYTTTLQAPADGEESAASFRPANPQIAPTHSFTFSVMGDGGQANGYSESGLHVFKEQIQSINLLSPDFAVIVGDSILGYVQDSQTIESMWDEFDTLASKFQVPIVMVPGNHDIWDRQSKVIWEKRLGPKYFSFIHKKCHFIILNSEAVEKNRIINRIDDAQFEWLKAELEKYPGATLRFVFLHKPYWLAHQSPDYFVRPFWLGENTLNNSAEQWKEKIHPLFVKHHVNAVFAGHLHKYLNSGIHDGVAYYVSGGGGGPIEKADIELLGGFYHFMSVTVRGATFHPAVIRPGGVVDQNIVTNDMLQGFSYYRTTPLTDFLFTNDERAQNITMDVINPLSQSVTANIAWQVSPATGWRIKPVNTSLTMKVNEKEKISFDVKKIDETAFPLPLCTIALTPADQQLDQIELSYILPVKPMPIKCKPVKLPPIIDGNINEPCWKKAESVGNFVVLEEGDKSKLNTILKVLYDETKIYFAFRCQSPPRPIKPIAVERDGPVWDDDHIEIFMDYNPEKDNSYLHLCVNSLGTIYDGVGQGGTSEWNGDWVVATTEDDYGWSVEIAFDLASGPIHSPEPGTAWRFNACRSCPKINNGRVENSSWSVCQKSFHEAGSFGEISFE